MSNASRQTKDGTRAGLVCLGALLAIGGAVPPAAAAPASECKQYADRAVTDFNTATNPANAANCHVSINARWQPNWQNHYDWCLTVSKAAYLGEKNARNTYLIQCHARVKIEGTN